MPETNSVWSLTLTNRTRNSLLHAHVHERIVSVLHIDQSPSLHQDPDSPGFAASIALTKSSGATPRPRAPVPRKKRSTRSFSSFSLNGTSSSIISSFGRLSSGIRKKSPERSEEHTSELQSQSNLVCRLLLEKKKTMY